MITLALRIFGTYNGSFPLLLFRKITGLQVPRHTREFYN